MEHQVSSTEEEGVFQGYHSHRNSLSFWGQKGNAAPRAKINLNNSKMSWLIHIKRMIDFLQMSVIISRPAKYKSYFWSFPQIIPPFPHNGLLY